MADAPKKTSSSGKGLTKKAGPLPVWGWFAFAGGGFLVYRFIKARQSAGAVNAASGTTGGDLIPNDIGLPSSTGGTTATFTSVGAWTEALLENLTQAGISPGDAYTAAQAYLNGTCVTQGAYNAIAAAILSPNVGLPPGFYSPPSLSVCPTATTTTGTTTPSSGGLSGRHGGRRLDSDRRHRLAEDRGLWHRRERRDRLHRDRCREQRPVSGEGREEWGSGVGRCRWWVRPGL